MCKVKKIIRVLPVLLLLIPGASYSQTSEIEMMTLFTTAQERELINKNRYKKQTVKAVVEVVAPKDEEHQEEEKTEQQEVKLSVSLAGVTLSQSGQNIAWLNGKALENGSKLDDGSIVYISKKIKNLVQIKTPDGKYHSITTGETIELSYFKRIEG